MLPTLISGHEADGRPARGHDHLHCLFDPTRERILLLLSERPRHASITARFEQALAPLSELKAGRAGLLRLRHHAVDRTLDPLFGASRIWRSVTPYHVNRHLRRGRASDALAADVEVSCAREGLPPVAVTVNHCGGSPRGLGGFVELRFETEVEGPVALGQTRHLGGGLFEAAPETLEPGSRLFGAVALDHRARGKLEALSTVLESRGFVLDADARARLAAVQAAEVDELLRRAWAVEGLEALFDAIPPR